jgi:hypothetical protein
MLLQTAQKSGAKLEGALGCGECGAPVLPVVTSANIVIAGEAMLTLPI